jgi:hypothetical protein
MEAACSPQMSEINHLNMLAATEDMTVNMDCQENLKTDIHG